MAKRDYYEVLCVERDVDGTTLKRAYRKLAVQFHPDRNPDDAQAEENFKEAAEAYEVLSDPQRRQTYDRFGHRGLEQTGFTGFSGFDDIFSHFEDIFGDIFGFGGGGGGRRSRRGRGADLRFDMALAFEEAVFGVEREIRVQRWESCVHCGGSGAEPGSQPTTCATCKGRGQVVHSQGLFMLSTTCPHCRGAGQIVTDTCNGCEGRGKERVAKTITVKVPAGVDNGTRIRLSGEGEPGDGGGIPGDLYVFVRVEPHEFFERDDDTLHCEVPLSIVQATLGDKIDVPTLDGSERLKVRAGTQPGDVQRVRRKGVPRLRGSGRGDLYVHFKVVVPSKVSRKQRDLLQKFAELA